MATLTVTCKNGDATVEVVPGESAAETAARLARAIEAAGGRPEPKAKRPKLMTVEQRRHEQMRERQLIECQKCGFWLPPIMAAVERHERKYHATEAVA